MEQNINAGDLRHMVQLTRSVGLPTSPFDPAAPNSVVGIYPALVEQVSAAEVTNANQNKGLRYYKVTMRARPINPTDVLVWKGRKLNVRSAVTDPFGIVTVVDAAEQVTQQ